MNDQLRITPTDIRQSSANELSIDWSACVKNVYPVRTLRLSCRCAHCVDEWSGQNTLDPESVPEDVHPTEIQPVGRYAISIHWSDGHNSGIYSFEHLRELGDQI